MLESRGGTPLPTEVSINNISQTDPYVNTSDEIDENTPSVAYGDSVSPVGSVGAFMLRTKIATGNPRPDRGDEIAFQQENARCGISGLRFLPAQRACISLAAPTDDRASVNTPEANSGTADYLSSGSSESSSPIERSYKTAV